MSNSKAMQSLKLLIPLGLLSALGWAQPVESPPGRPLQPGDQLEINIFTLPEVEKKYQVRADGTFFHPLAGEIRASGKTLPQLEALLRQRLSKELRKPQFRVGLTTMAEAECAVLGEVRSQGKYKVAPGSSIMDLLAQAGGINDKADLDGAVVLRAGRSIPLDLGPKGQAQLAAMQVQKGDIIYVNRGKRVGVSGEVQAKGIYVVSSRSTNPVEDAVKAAGGATEAGALNRVQIIRPSLAKPIEVDLLDPQVASQVGLEDGDTVMLPARRIVLLGAVGKPGPVNLVGKETLLDVVSSADPAKARLDSVVLVRAEDVQKGTDKKEIYNLQQAFQEGSTMVAVPVRDGDMVFVPNVEDAGMLGNPTGLMSLLVMARSLFAL